MNIFSGTNFEDKKKRIRISNTRPGSFDKAPMVDAPPAFEDVQEGLWERCSGCKSVIFSDDLIDNLNVCPRCGFHFRLGARQRIGYTADEGTFQEFNKTMKGENPINFPGYEEKLKGTRAFTSENEAIITGECEILGNPCVLAVMNGLFMMGSMGTVVGEKFVCAAERAMEKDIPLLAFTASGGARMQEGLFSLMQMSKVSAVLAKLSEQQTLYISILTDPTTGGVTASFASLGDIILAEPKALIGFAGRRVIEQTVKQVLPADFQKAEFLLE
ncbi:acetyl-CoA carboxylase, carboxyltransferase subunit beta, partial [Clostridia bacterium OttesenSCG-928-F22]|nr:acetyl-CoA carboxylase, carboxyltransferase subunit beta [Clostridia bacterium OttesenSCG-928-F22]